MNLWTHGEGLRFLFSILVIGLFWCLCKNDGGRFEAVLGLPDPPPASTYQTAIRKKAAARYRVPEAAIVIGEMKVNYYTELLGTIRGWEATAPVGRKSRAHIDPPTP